MTEKELLLNQTSRAGPKISDDNSSSLNQEKKFDDTARFLAGLKVDEQSELYDLTQTESWKRFSDKANALWAEFRIPEAKMRSWARRELEKCFDPAAPVFYAFGGPDIAFADIFLPGAKQYVLVGLESLGSVPRREAITTQRLEEALPLYVTALEDLIKLSFFRFLDLEKELAHPLLNGVIPLMMVVLARMDKETTGVEVGNLNGEGEFVSEPEESPGRKTAAKIQFRKPGDGTPQILFYFSTNLSDGDLQKNPAFNKFMQKYSSRCFSFIKSASYLMHKPYFSMIRKMILTLSEAILQDDSAISYRFFDKNIWDISLYGKYEGPIKLFEGDFEQDLFEAYKTPAKPIGFRFGYSPISNLLLAVKKTE